jgi:hypothetical protein
MKQMLITGYSRMSLYILCCTFLLGFITGCKKEDASSKEASEVASHFF